MTDLDITTAPWTDEQVKSLNEYQVSGVFHPFTCEVCRDADPNFPLLDDHILVATNEGWICPTCDYTQDWAHEWMSNPEKWKAFNWRNLRKL